MKLGTVRDFVACATKRFYEESALEALVPILTSWLTGTYVKSLDAPLLFFNPAWLMVHKLWMINKSWWNMLSGFKYLQFINDDSLWLLCSAWRVSLAPWLTDWGLGIKECRSYSFRAPPGAHLQPQYQSSSGPPATKNHKKWDYKLKYVGSHRCGLLFIYLPSPRDSST